MWVRLGSPKVFLHSALPISVLFLELQFSQDVIPRVLIKPVRPSGWGGLSLAQPLRENQRKISCFFCFLFFFGSWPVRLLSSLQQGDPSPGPFSVLENQMNNIWHKIDRQTWVFTAWSPRDARYLPPPPTPTKKKWNKTKSKWQSLLYPNH